MALSPTHQSAATTREQDPDAKAFVGQSLARYLRFVRATSHTGGATIRGCTLLEDGDPAILAVRNSQYLLLPLVDWNGLNVAAVLPSHEGTQAGQALAALGIERANGLGGTYSLRAALRTLRNGGCVALPADLPAGDPGIAILTLARLSGRPVIPVAIASSRTLPLSAFGRRTIPLPYTTLACVLGDPLCVPREGDAPTVERWRTLLASSLDIVAARAQLSAGSDSGRMSRERGPIAPPAPLSTGLKIYRHGTSLLRSAAPLLLRLRERQGKEDPRRRTERFGDTSAERPDGLLVWLHAASVGETNAVLPLIERLSSRRGDLTFVLTTGTVTSARLAGQRLGSRAIHQYLPLDVVDYAKRFLDHWRPDLTVLTESEIWPNLILETADRRIPLALVNGRMSARSFSRWRRSPASAEQLFSRFDVVLAQSEKLARNFTDLGARKVLTVGNLKTDAPPPPVDARELERLRTALKGRPIFVAASTHEGEEQIVADAHRRLARRIPGICTIIAPRHPERGTALAELLRSLGFSVSLRSLGLLPSERTDIYIADTIGELGTLYALAPVAFVGGSLIERGGQNPIEPVKHGAAVLTGPHWANFRDVYRALLRQKGAEEVADAAQMAETALLLITDEAELQRSRAGAKTALASLTGALDRTADVLEALLPPAPEGVRRAS